MSKRYFILFIALIFFTLSSTARAQVKSTDIILNISPENPKANQEVRASLETFVTDLNKAYITWSINGEKINAGIGKKSFNFNTGNFTADIYLIATIETTDGKTSTKNINLSPAFVDILWESTDGFAPPFYRGKVLGGSEGNFKIVAMPVIPSENGLINPKNLSYNWKRDHTLKINSSGWGKNSFNFKSSYIDGPSEIQVDVSDILNGVNTSDKIVLYLYEPKIVFYEKDPIFGLKMEKSLANEFFVKKEGTIISAVPFFMPISNLNSTDIKFNWFIGGGQVDTPKNKNELSVKPDTNKGGSTNIKVIVNNTRAFLKSIEKEISVNF